MRTKSPWLLTVGLAIYVALFVIRDIIQINVPGAIIMLWIVGVLLFVPRTEMMKAIFFIMPFASGFPGYIILFALVLLIVKSKKINAWQLMPPVIIALLEFISVSFYDFDVRFQSVISYIGFVFLFFYILFDKDSQIDKRSYVRYFCYGTVITLLIVYIPIIMNHGFFALIAGEARDGLAMGLENKEDALGHLVMNANTIAYFSISLLSLLLLGRNKLGITSNLVYYFALFIAIAAGLLSFSRTWLMLTAVVVVVYVFNSRHRIVATILVIMSTSVIMTTQNIVVESISGVFQTRMEDENMETGNGRFDIFREYNQAWVESPKYVIMGAGASNYRQALNQEYSMHNGLQQIWVCHGVIGFMIFLLAILKYMKSYRNRSLSSIYFLPFFACFIFDQSIQFLVPYTLMLPFLPTLYVLAFNNEGANRNVANLSKA